MDQHHDSHPGTDETITTPTYRIVLAWAVVMVPLAWGFIETLIKASQLFR